MTIRIGRIVTGLALVLTLALVGCGEGDPAGDPADTGPAGQDSATPGSADEDLTETPAETAVEVLGRWEVLSQNGTLVHAGELCFTFLADGTGTSLEGTSEKAFTWVHDPGDETLHILTDDEDTLFRIAMAGETLTLVLSDPPTTLVLRRAPDSAPAPGSHDVE